MVIPLEGVMRRGVVVLSVQWRWVVAKCVARVVCGVVVVGGRGFVTTFAVATTSVGREIATTIRVGMGQVGLIRIFPGSLCSARYQSVWGQVCLIRIFPGSLSSARYSFV